MALTVSQLAKLAKVSVRTLHHYDELGLLRPSGRSAAGYRLYERPELERLQQILFFKALGFPLEEVQRILGDPAFDLGAALLHQRRMLEERAVQVQALLRAVDRALSAHERGIDMKESEMFEQFEEEAEQRWGDTEAFKTSRRRAARYTKEDWDRIRAEAEANEARFAELLDRGVAADAPEAKTAARAHREHISRWFYECTPQLHRGLAELYVADERFAAHYDRRRPGLARYVRDAILAAAESQVP